MSYLITGLSAAIFTIVLLAIYKYALNPQIVVTPDPSTMDTCPDRWTFDPNKQMCEPNYPTHCLPFNPKSSNLTTVAQKCALAQRCNTGWSGMCG